MENNKTPSIRFKGFTDPWEQRKLGDQMFIKSRIGWQALTKKEYLETGDYYLITGTDIDEDKHIVDFNCCYYVSKERYEMDDKIQVYEGDIIVTKDGTIGKVAMVTGLDKPATLNSHLFVLRDLSGKLYNRFLLQVLVSHIFGDFVESTKTGSTLTGLPQKTFVEFRFLMPEMDEQMKIAQYLDNLDNLITLHQRKYNKLLNVKKSMLEKMFPKNGSNIPEIRFKGFTDPWEQRKLGDTNTFFTDGNYGEAYPKASDMTDSSTGIPFLTGGNLKNGRLDLSGANYITYEKHMKLTSGHLAEDDIVIAVRGSLGALGYVNKENSGWNINSQLAILRTDKTVLIGKYLIQFLLSTTGQKELLSKQTGSALKQLPISSLKDIAIPITSIEEQERIGMYLQNLDNLITLHQRELEKLQYIKKSMLEKMFV